MEMELTQKEIEFYNKCESDVNRIPTIIGKKERIIAIGDIHGDFKLLKECLRLCDVIDNNNNWIGGKTIVVQVGDQVDRCRFRKGIEECKDNITKDDENSDVLIIEFMNNLAIEAKKHGGNIISIIGNHELMNVMGDMRYVSKAGIDGFGGLNNRIELFKPGNKYGKLIGCTRMPCVIIGSFLFSHAGIIDQFAEELNIKNENDLININLTVRQWLIGLLNVDDYLVKDILENTNSMFWNRILGTMPNNIDSKHELCKQSIGKSLQIFNLKGMVIGHTVQPDTGIVNTCGKQIIKTDFAGSKAFDRITDEGIFNNPNRTAQVLEILNDEELYVIYKNKTKKQLI